MNTNNNTILVTGGSAGIGFAIAQQFIAAGNQVIITGRNEERLREAAARLGQVTAIRCDVTNEQEVAQLVARVKTEFPGLNMLINNAGSAFIHHLLKDTGTYSKAGEEMLTNYLSVVRLTEQLLPVLQQQREAAIVNVTSIVAFAPSAILATYAASKAALHSYSQSLRYTLQHHTGIRVFELMPPLVDTNFSKEIGGEKGIKPEVVATALLDSMRADEYEIHVGGTADLYRLFLHSPQEALAAMNSSL